MPDTVDADARARVGRAIRDLGHAVIRHQAPVSLLDEVAATLNDLTTRLSPGEVRRRDEEIYEADVWGPELAQGPVEGYDDRPFSGRASPWGLDLEVHRHGDEVEALLTLGPAHEGAPERTHGGIVAGLFDDVFGFVLGVIQQAAFTGELTIRYERPTPLHRPLACRGRLAERSGRKIWIEGELVDLGSDEVVARGRGVFIAVDRVSARLPAPPDEDAPPALRASGR